MGTYANMLECEIWIDKERKSVVKEALEQAMATGALMGFTDPPPFETLEELFAAFDYSTMRDGEDIIQIWWPDAGENRYSEEHLELWKVLLPLIPGAYVAFQSEEGGNYMWRWIRDTQGNIREVEGRVTFGDPATGRVVD